MKTDTDSSAKNENLPVLPGLSENKSLILYNDECNTFEHVIESLVEVCKHNKEQAEQCAFIAHFKGKCDVKSGSYNQLKPLKQGLIDKGLTVSID